MNKEQASAAVQTDRRSYLWLAIATVLLVFTYGMYRTPLGALFAPVFLLRFFRGQKTGRGFLFVLLALIVSNIISWWNTTYENPAVGRVIIGAMFGLMYSLGFLPDRLLVRRFRGFAATLVFPLSYTAWEFLTTWPSPMSSYNSLGYGLSSSEYFSQLASLTGLWGVTFIICWFASMVNWLWEESLVWERVRRGLAIYGAVMLVIFLYGLVRLTVFLPEPSTTRIHGIIETNYTVEQWRTAIAPKTASDPASVKAFITPDYDRYLNATQRESRGGAQIVVWPELAVLGYREDLDTFFKRASDLARRESIYLGFGYGLLDPAVNPLNVSENRFMIIDPQGQIVVDQLKYGCTLAFRMYSTQLQIVDTPYGRLAGVICCDTDFPYVLRQTSQKGVDILIIPAFEPTRENLWAHSQIVPFRAVENGVAIFRVTAKGLSMAVDPYGRILGVMDDTLVTQQVFAAELPNRRVTTLYTLVGDDLGWLAVVGVLVMIALAVINRRKSQPSG